MGKPRKPIELQKGHITTIQKIKKKDEEKAVTTEKDQLEKIPRWLIDAVARKEWKRLVQELKEIDMIGNLDYNNLGAYCNAFSNYVKVTAELKDQDYCIRRETRTGAIIVQNPLIGIQKNYADEMRRFAALCGLTIDSRLKAATVKTEQKDEEIKQKFGNI